MAAIVDGNYNLWCRVEDLCAPPLTPSPVRYTRQLMGAAVLACAGVVTAAAATMVKVVQLAQKYFEPKPDPNTNFSAVLDDSRLWNEIRDPNQYPGLDDPAFLMGPATCTYQDSGAENCPHSQWASWEQQRIPEHNRSGRSANLFQLYQTEGGRALLLNRLRKLRAKSYRLSVEWSQIQSTSPTNWNEPALQIYVGLCRYLKANGIEPIVTLHHFSEPQWFHKEPSDKLGSFGNPENVSYFVRFADRVIDALASDVKYFCTINEPGIEAFSRYIRGAYSPGRYFHWTDAATFLKGAIQAHQNLYALAKAKHPGAQIGIVHQYLRLVPTNPLVALPLRYVTQLINGIMLKVFKTGHLEFKIPFICNVSHDFGEFNTDFVGVQYYTRALIGFTGPTSYYEPMTLMPFREDPEGLYEAIAETHKACEKPIMVTENGISTNDENQRLRYMTRALYAAAQAAKVIPLIGYSIWSFCDNFEWELGMNPQRFGVYPVTGRHISDLYKRGVQPFVDMCTAWHARRDAQAPVAL